MNEKVLKLGIKREPGFLYYWEELECSVKRIKISASGRDQSAQPETVAKAKITKDLGYLYFIDVDGDLSRTDVRGNSLNSL